MKRLATTVAALAMVFAFAVQASAQTIVGSAHDFSGATWKSDGGQICNVCHTPHNPTGIADGVTIDDAPLWDHAVSAATYTPYAGYDLQATINNAGIRSGTSLLCLSCHDGSVAVENFGGVSTGTQTMDLINTNADLTEDLTDDHPVGFVYETATTDTEIKARTASVTGAFAATVQDMLEGTGATATMECSSCHDVHNGFGSTYGGPLLISNNDGSEICLACHAK